MSSESIKLARQIKQARQRLDLSQSEASAAWEVPVRTLQKWEQAATTPRGETLDRLWEIFFPELADSPKRKKR